MQRRNEDTTLIGVRLYALSVIREELAEYFRGENYDYVYYNQPLVNQISSALYPVAEMVIDVVQLVRPYNIHGIDSPYDHLIWPLHGIYNLLVGTLQLVASPIILAASLLLITARVLIYNTMTSLLTLTGILPKHYSPYTAAQFFELQRFGFTFAVGLSLIVSGIGNVLRGVMNLVETPFAWLKASIYRISELELLAAPSKIEEDSRVQEYLNNLQHDSSGMRYSTSTYLLNLLALHSTVSAELKAKRPTDMTFFSDHVKHTRQQEIEKEEKKYNAMFNEDHTLNPEAVKEYLASVTSVRSGSK